MTARARPKGVPLLLFLIFILQSVELSGRDPLDTAINGPCRLAVDGTGNLFVSEEYGKRILRIDWKRNAVEVVAGNGKECCFKENGLARQSSIYGVYSIALDENGNLYMGGRNHDDGAFVRVVDKSTQCIKYFATSRSAALVDGAPHVNAEVFDPTGIVPLRSGALLVSAYYHIVEFGKSTVTFAGIPDRMGFSGDGGPALEATFHSPHALALDCNGNVYVADYHNHRIRRIDGETRIVATVAGDGSETSSGDGGPATSAGVRYPFDIAVDGQNNIFIIENGAWTVRRVDAKTGLISTIAGTGQEGYSGDGGPATHAKIDACGLALDQEGNIYVADLVHNRIRHVDAHAGIITTVAGNGLPKRKAVIE